MSLATRCTACGTVFRVVQDQLKMSEGWVRCGRCQEVFNALEGLFELDLDATAREEPPAAQPPVPGASLSGRVQVDDPAPAVHDDSGDQSAPATVADDLVATAHGSSVESRLSTQFDTEAAPSSPIGESTAAASAGAVEAEGDFADARFNTALLAADAAAADDGDAALVPQPAPPPPIGDDASALPAPSFLSEAGRTERWQRPRMRSTLALSAVALSALLVLQAALQFHDAIAARWPVLHAPLAGLCSAAGCAVEPPLQLDAVSVDSSGLARIVDHTDLYRLSLVLRNRADFAVATPSVELSLTDSNGRLVARRVFAPAEFNAAPAALAPLAETALQLALGTGERISGYTIEVFYP